MTHVGTTCTIAPTDARPPWACGRSETGMEIVRGDNRDKSGIKAISSHQGRYAFDFANREDRLTQR